VSSSLLPKRFAELVEPLLGKAAFFADHWQRAPLFVPGARDKTSKTKSILASSMT
jgi:hypothetical protein